MHFDLWQVWLCGGMLSAYLLAGSSLGDGGCTQETSLAISNMVGKRIGGRGMYHGVSDMIFSLYVERNPVAGSRDGVDFTFHVMRYHPRFTTIEEDGHADGVK